MVLDEKILEELGLKEEFNKYLEELKRRNGELINRIKEGNISIKLPAEK